VGVLCGLSSALFLVSLEAVTQVRGAHEALVWCLPLVGLAMGWALERVGGPMRGGNNLVIDALHDDGPELPLRMAPLVLGGTLLTHLFGGSAGREGTAVQMGAALSDWVGHRLGLRGELRREVLVAGVAGGFGAVFGTPIAGAIFGAEFVVIGRVEARALWPGLVAALVGDLVVHGLGVGHTRYPSPPTLALSPLLALKWLAFALAIAAVAAAFIELTHAIKALGARARLPWRMALGGLAVVGLWWMAGTSDYLGLGVPMIERAFRDPDLPVYAFAAKLVFTAVTVGSGFLGGEVTPLFLIGAALGNALAQFLGLPLELGAGVGMAAMFAAASNTPLALSVMVVELLGAALLPHALLVSVAAHLLVGRRSIYPAQRARWGLDGEPLERPTPLHGLDKKQ
jgi:H+/Cl- antiporter ClcA